jgi:hypothetical protein
VRCVFKKQESGELFLSKSNAGSDPAGQFDQLAHVFKVQQAQKRLLV